MRNLNEKLAIYLLLATSLLTSYSLIPAANAATSDFTITANPEFLAVTVGTSGYTQVYLASQNGFTGSVTVTSSITAGPTGTRPELNPSSKVLAVTSDGATYTLYIVTTSATTQGIYTVTITGVAVSTSHTTTVNVVVNPPLPPPAPSIIGGTLIPVNKLVLLSPFIALVGVVGAVLGFVYIKRKEENR